MYVQTRDEHLAIVLISDEGLTSGNGASFALLLGLKYTTLTLLVTTHHGGLHHVLPLAVHLEYFWVDKYRGPF